MCFDFGFLWPKRDAQIRRENPSISWEYKKSDLVLTRVTSLVSQLVSGSVDGAGAGAWDGWSGWRGQEEPAAGKTLVAGSTPLRAAANASRNDRREGASFKDLCFCTFFSSSHGSLKISSSRRSLKYLTGRS